MLRAAAYDCGMVADVQDPGGPLFDRAHLSRYTDGDSALEAELLGLFRDQAQRCLGLMDGVSDRGAWRAAAHTLKGSARGVGAMALGELCDKAEELHQPSWAPAQARIALLVDETLAEMGLAEN